MGSVNVTVRMDEETKEDFEIFCQNVRLNITTAFNMFVKSTLRTRELPFIVTDVQTKVSISTKGKEAFHTAQKNSILNGTSDMTIEEINAEIKEYRRGKNTKE